MAIDRCIDAALQQRLDRFHAEELGCSVEDLHAEGIRVVTTPRRYRPGWGGYTVPFLALATQTGSVVSVRSEQLARVSGDFSERYERGWLTWDDYEALRRLSKETVPYAYCLSGDVLYTDRARFRPVTSRATRLLLTDPSGADLRRRFDGSIFVIRNTRREIVSWAAIKLKSDDVWELAVVTERAYRGQGLAREVVSAATEFILENDRVALYVHDRSNDASARVCRSLGYVEYGREFFSEY
ncbi:MAG: GNAT family N-acetyltransferase [Chloroflexota bacterium]